MEGVDSVFGGGQRVTGTHVRRLRFEGRTPFAALLCVPNIFVERCLHIFFISEFQNLAAFLVYSSAFLGCLIVPSRVSEEMVSESTALCSVAGQISCPFGLIPNSKEAGDATASFS